MHGRYCARIAIIVPVYNNEKVVQRCIDSVLGQTFQDLELILVDDGSKDASGAVCDAAAAADARVKVIHKRNEGLVRTWMRGVKESSAPYLMFVDGDDWIEPQMLGEMYACLEEPGFAGSPGGQREADSSAGPERRREADSSAGPERRREADSSAGPERRREADSNESPGRMREACSSVDPGGMREACSNEESPGGRRPPREIVCCSYVIDREWDGTSERSTHRAAPGVYEGERLQKEIKDVLLGHERRLLIASRCMKLFSRELIEDNLHWCDPAIRMGEDLNITTPAILDADRITVMDSAYYYHYIFYPTSMVHAYDPGLYDNVVLLRAKLLEILMAKGVPDALEMTEREYLFLMCIEMKNELRCTIGPAADVVGRIQDICAQEHTGELTKFYPEGVKDPANRIIVWMMNYPSSIRVHAARRIFLAQAKKAGN